MVKYNLMDQIGQQPTKDGGAVKQVFFTQKTGTLYAITPGWPGKQLVLRELTVPANPTSTMLGVPGALNTRAEGNSLVIETPALSPDVVPCRHAYVFKIPGATVLRQQ
jgi:alpha-L-fucosidase